MEDGVPEDRTFYVLFKEGSCGRRGPQSSPPFRRTPKTLSVRSPPTIPFYCPETESPWLWSQSGSPLQFPES